MHISQMSLALPRLRFPFLSFSQKGKFFGSHLADAKSGAFLEDWWSSLMLLLRQWFLMSVNFFMFTVVGSILSFFAISEILELGEFSLSGALASVRLMNISLRAAHLCVNCGIFVSSLRAHTGVELFAFRAFLRAATCKASNLARVASSKSRTCCAYSIVGRTICS